MAQHDAVIDNQAGAAIRTDLNNFLAAIISNSSGATAPATTYAYMWWADTTTGLLKQRNAANSAWITIGTLADTYLGLASLAADSRFTGHNTFQGRLNVASSVGGTVDAITAVFAPTFTALVNGMGVTVRASGANTSATPSFAPDGLTAKTIVKENLAALVAGDIKGAGHELLLIYNSTADKWVLRNPAGSVTAAATQAQIQAESSNAVFATPSNLKYRLGSVDPETKSEFYEDFEHEVTAGSVFGKSAWVNAPTLVGVVSLIAGTGGIARFSTSSSTDMHMQLKSSFTSLPWVSFKNFILKCRLRNYGSGGNARSFGLTDIQPDSGTANVIRVTWTPGGNIFLRCRAGSTETALDSAVAMEASPTFHTIKVVVTGTTSVELFVDGVSKGTITTNIPSAALGLWLMMSGSGTTSDHGIESDYIQIVQDR